MERYDIAIIGTGPAGLEAAITATIRNKRVILLGSKDLSRKLIKAHEIQNYLGFPAVKGEDLALAFQRHLDQLGILATGVVQGKPLPGEEEALGHGVSYCATCDAALVRGKKVAVVGFSAKEETEAAFLSEICPEVLYFPTYGETGSLPENVKVIPEKVAALERTEVGMLLRTGAGEYPVHAVFVLRDAVAPGQLVPGLETEGPHVRVNRSMESSLPGLFACGDIVGPPYQYIKAAGEGNIAALSAVSYLSAAR